MEQNILLVGGDRRQTCLASLLTGLGAVQTYGVPGFPNTGDMAPCDLLILPFPSLDSTGRFRMGTEGMEPTELIRCMDGHTQVFGGGLKRVLPLLESKCRCVTDLLEDPQTLAANARLTAEAALVHVILHTEQSLRDRTCAVLGFGRIGKCLAQLLWENGARVVVAARRPEILAEAESLGFTVCPLADYLCREELVFNTVPSRIIQPERLADSRCLWIELASAPGGLPNPAPSEMDVLPAGGLPGKYFSRSAADILYRGILRHLR